MAPENVRDIEEIFEDLLEKFNLGIVNTCPTCSLHGKPRTCPKCGRKVCTSCLAVDLSDCIACGPEGDTFLELKERLNG